MKRKFILYPAVALALMTSASLSSCVDTDEPESLENLRNAVAQEVQANATLLNAKADVEKAYVAVINAQAKQEEAAAAKAEYENVSTKAKEELAAQIAQISMEENEAAKAQKIEAAKLAAETATNNAKADLEAAVAAYKAAIETAKTTVRNAEYETMEAELKNKVDIARLNAEGVKSDLEDKLKAYNTANKNYLKKLAEIENYFLENENDPVTLATKEKEMIEAKKAYDKAQADADLAKSEFESKGVDAFAKLWKAKADSVEAVAGKLSELSVKERDLKNQLEDLEEAQTAAVDAFNKADKAYNDKKSELSKGYNTQLTDLADKEEDLAFDCTNDVLQGIVGDVEGFTFKDKKYTSNAKVANKNLATATQTLKKKFNFDVENTGLNQLDLNKRIHAAVEAALLSGEKAAKTAQDDAEKEWKKALKTYNTDMKSDTKYEAACKELKKAAIVLFGSYAGTKDNDDLKEGNWAWFTSDNVTVDNYETMLKNAGITPDRSKMGAIGVYLNAKESNNKEVVEKIKTDAAAVVQAIDDKIKAYETAKKAIEDKKNAIESDDAVKALKADADAKKTAKETAENAVKAMNNKIKAEVTDEKTRIEAQKTDDERMRDEYYKAVTKVSDFALEGATRADIYEAYKTAFLQLAENNVASTKADYDSKYEDYKAYVDGTYVPKDKLKKLENEAAELKEKLEEAKTEYETLKSYYGIN